MFTIRSLYRAPGVYSVTTVLSEASNKLNVVSALVQPPP